MALRLRGIARRIRENVAVFVGAFLLGTIFGLLILCSPESPKVKEEKAIAEFTSVPEEELVTTPVTKAVMEITEETENATEIATETEKPTLKLEPYPPLLTKKGLIITPQACPEDLFLLIIVITSSRNFEARKAIRKSWGEDNSEKNKASDESFRVIYVVGSDDEHDRLVKREAKRYKDILRGGFKDVYIMNEGHSVKILLGLKWVTTSCKAKFFLKTTDESFVNTEEMISFLKKKNDVNEGLYAGFCHGHDVGGAKVVRNQKSPWYISEEEWPEKRLPPYASGMGIAMSYDVVEKVVDLSLKEKLIHLDDVYLGIMAKKLSLKCTDESTKFDTSYTTMLTECEDMNFCVIGGVPPKDMFFLTQNVKNLRDIC